VYIMEMHQVRYFLAVANALNFTRAAEECHVAQPSLTRAIKLLEFELGGDLFRRERPHAQLTVLGQRMVPHLKQCYESALGARSLASSIKSGDVCAVTLAVSHTIELEILLPYLRELVRHFNKLEVNLVRGTGAEIIEFLKKGDADLAIAAELGDGWDRLDTWPLFTETFVLLVNKDNRFSSRKNINIDELRHEQFVIRTHCEQAGRLVILLRSHAIEMDGGHKSSERDLMTLVEVGMGVAFVPRSAACPKSVARITVDGLDLRRTVQLYGVAGRQRTVIGTTIMKMLRSADWSQYIN
jgi:DNA-binding transcriptional LysR family regulator